MSTTLSKFTPSNMPYELLQDLFVVRGPILDAVEARIVEAASGSGRNHTLLVGPRGAGKTHLVSLAHHRTLDLIRNGEKLQVAWPAEDLFWITSYEALLTEIASQLPGISTDVASSSATASELEYLLIAEVKRHGPIVLFVENLDQVFTAIGEGGQQKLRRFLEIDKALLLVASTTSVGRPFTDDTMPFYGFFTVSRLEPFEVGQARDMLRKIAEVQGQTELFDYLGTDQAFNRLAAINHLAGGQPRVWATLASAVTIEGIDELVELLLAKFDDLTPYYQEQMGRLSEQQRHVVGEFLRADRAMSVIELSERSRIEQRSAAKTLIELKERGWVRPVASPFLVFVDGRRTYYELAEPLARMAMLVKSARDRPVRLVVEFMKSWFDSQHRAPSTTDSTLPLRAAIDDALVAAQSGDGEPIMGLSPSIRSALDQRLDPDAPLDDQISSLRLAVSV